MRRQHRLALLAGSLDVADDGLDLLLCSLRGLHLVGLKGGTEGARDVLQVLLVALLLLPFLLRLLSRPRWLKRAGRLLLRAFFLLFRDCSMMAGQILEGDNGLARRRRFAEEEFVGSYVVGKNVGLALHFLASWMTGNYNKLWKWRRMNER